MEFTKDIIFDSTPTSNNEITITYNGFLSNSSEVAIVYGFRESWEHTTETNMQKTENGFVAKINLLDFDTFNFCFKNSNNEWDNNSNCNYISPITQENIENFDIDALIEEILQPLIHDSVEQTTDNTSIQATSQTIDLGAEITQLLSQISTETSTEELHSYNTLEEILSCSVIEETPLELFEQKSNDAIVNEIIENTTKLSTKDIPEGSAIIEETTEINSETSLVNIETPFTISPRQLSKFYLWRKRIKLAFYKALIRIPKLIFGNQEQ